MVLGCPSKPLSPLTNESDVLLNLVNTASCHEATSLCYKSINIALTPLPVVNRYVSDTADVAQRGQGRVQE